MPRPPLFKSSCLIILIPILIWLDHDEVNCQTKLPPGYYAFETGSRKHGSPPRVLPPPYHPSDTVCPGVSANGFMYSPRDTLCGDLNKAYVPRNPLGQAIHNQPYPFELIKNKTLHFLAKSLPFLKDDIDSIPKVVKLSKPEHQRDPQAGEPSDPLTSSYYDYAHVKKRSVRESSSGSGTATTGTSFWKRRSGKAQLFGNNWNLTEARQKACEQKDGLMCQLVNSLNGNGILSQAAQVISAAQTAASTAQSISSLASLLHHFSGSSEQPSNSFASQVAMALQGAGGGGIGGNGLNSGDEMSSGIGSSNFNPLVSVLDYLSRNGQEKSGSQSLQLAAQRRKKPMDLDETIALASEQSASITTNKIPPTPCPSLEEYVAPVFARNYQGVWKYIVQIPHEGYFTQTVQKTSCVKTKCDFMDGSCHESPRWVSLLVAEIFYPDARFPNPLPMPAPSNHYEHFAANNNPLNAYHQQVNNKPDKRLHSMAVHPIQVTKGSSWRSVDGEEIPNSLTPQSEKDSSQGTRRVSKRQVGEEPSNDLDGKKNSVAGNDERECDGVDKIGCYTVRVYYDWFLVPGSCKCWKKSSQGSLDALKKIVFGK